MRSSRLPFAIRLAAFETLARDRVSFLAYITVKAAAPAVPARMKK